MTDHTTFTTDDTDHMDAMDDLELITSALNGHLDPVRLAEVRRRLDEDPAFRDLAAPLILTWSVPKHFERHPRPVGELERDWNAFAKKMGVGKRRRGARLPSGWRLIRYPLIVIIALLLAPYAVSALASLTFGAQRSEPGTTAEDVARAARASAEVVPLDLQWDSLDVGVWMRTEGRTTTRLSPWRRNGMLQLDLTGTARFRIVAIDSTEPRIRERTLAIRTRAGVVEAGESEFTVIARADTTVVHVHPIRHRAAVQSWTSMVQATTVLEDDLHSSVRVGEFAGAILQRDRRPQLLRAIVDQRTP